CNEYKQNSGMIAAIDSSTDIVVLQPPMLTTAGETNPQGCWDFFKSLVPAGKEFGVLVTNTTAGGYFNPSQDPNVVAQGDITLDNMVRTYTAGNGSLYIPGSSWLRSLNYPDRTSLDNAVWYQADTAHPNSKAAYAYVAALYQFITSRNVVGGPAALNGFQAPVVTQQQATDIQNYTYALSGKGPYFGKTLNLAVNTGGRLEAFYTSSNANSSLTDTPFHTWQVGSNWQGERLMGQTENRFKGITKAKRIATARDAAGRLNLFFIGLNDILYWMRQTSTNAGTSWTNPDYLGSASAKEVTAIANTSGDLEVFYIGTDNVLYHNWQIGGVFQGQALLGSTSKQAKQLAVGRHTDGHLEVFYSRFSDDMLAHSWRESSGAWTDEAPLKQSSYKARQIATGLNDDGRMEVFYSGTDDVVYHIWWQNGSGWSNEATLGTSSNKAKRLAVGNHQNGKIEVAYLGLNNTPYHMYQPSTGGWTSQQLLGTSSNAGLELAIQRDSAGRLEVVYLGTDNKLYHFRQTAQNSGSWSAEAAL
ncbi:MAG TPA: hypothetical protein VJR89_40250, partial [Polyangiales bacterium]|nr:hypothetical protein [Polyangiales bacterium]